MIDLLITNGLILTVDRERTIIENGAVAVDGGKIVAVEVASALGAQHRARKIIDATGKLVMPGFVNAHTHLVSALSRGMLDELESVPWLEKLWTWYYSSLDERLTYLSTMLCCLEMIRTGTTTVCDCGTFPEGMGESTASAVSESGMRAVLGRLLWDLYDPRAVKGVPAHLQESTEQGLARAEQFIQRHHRSAQGRIQVWLDLHQVPNSSDELCRGAKHLSDRYDVGILTHAGVSRGLVQMTRSMFGMPDIERLESLGLLGPRLTAAHMGWVNGHELVLLKEREANVVYCPSTSMHLAYGTVVMGHIPEMLSMGINVALGSDGANCSNSLDMVRMLYLAASLHKEARMDPTLISAGDALEMATRNGARALGLEDEVGSIEPGKRADIVLFDLLRPEWVPFSKQNVVSNLVYAANGDSADTVIIDGQVVMENRAIKTVDERQVLAECEEAFTRLLSSKAR